MSTHTLETILEAFAIFNGFDGPSNDELWWRTDGDYAPVTLLVNCNDEFVWGCSDCEILTPEDIPDLKLAIIDAKAAGDQRHGALLWVARKRGQRPQGAMYKYLKESIHPLFNAAGPYRATGISNPVDVPK